MKKKTRRSNIETRNKHEIRIPKYETFGISDLEFLICLGFRTSDLGFVIGESYE